MSPTDPTTPTSDRRLAHARLCVLAIIVSFVTCLIAAAYPSGPRQAANTPSGLAHLAWIWAQSFVLVIPGLLIGAAVASRLPKTGLAIGGTLIIACPFAVLCDAITYSWIGERFFSGSVWRLATSLRESLTNHVSAGTIVFAGTTLVLFFLGSGITVWTCGRIATRITHPWKLVGAAGILACIASIPAVWQFERTRMRMSLESARHPLCVIRMLDYRGVGPETSQTEPGGGGLASTMEDLIADREQRHLSLGVTLTNEPLPDVLIVIIESFRHELVDPDVMPSLWDLAQRGTHCQRHFSGGNATTHGFFSLLNGMEAVWYSRAMKSQPLLNRLFRSAGYEIGFFAGHNDWKKFHMESFISRDHFDVFETDTPNWLESDRRATQRTINFLKRSINDHEAKPRLAMLYLYSTHADYHSYPQDRIFKPAADDRFVIPFQERDAPEIWNRYKNSARSIDRFLSAVISDQRVTIVTGDHGEAFLEDGVCGHGVRVSRFQNMTPAVLYRPGQTARTLSEPTTHADLLPTLLSAVGLTVTDPSALDGLDLFSASSSQLGDRLFVTRNYLSDDCALIGAPLTQAFGFRCAIDLDEWRAIPLNPIDDGGYETAADLDGEATLKRWIENRFPTVKQGIRL